MKLILQSTEKTKLITWEMNKEKIIVVHLQGAKISPIKHILQLFNFFQ